MSDNYNPYYDDYDDYSDEGEVTATQIYTAAGIGIGTIVIIALVAWIATLF